MKCYYTNDGAVFECQPDLSFTQNDKVEDGREKTIWLGMRTKFERHETDKCRYKWRSMFTGTPSSQKKFGQKEQK